MIQYTTMSDKQEQQTTIGVRFPESLVQRIDRLAEQLKVEQPGALRITRSEVIRLAALRGIAALEAEQGPSKKKKQ